MKRIPCLSVIVCLALALMMFAYSGLVFAVNLPDSAKKSPFGDKKNMTLLIIDVGDANSCTTESNKKCIKYKALKDAFVSISATYGSNTYESQVAKGYTNSQGTFSVMVEKGNSYKIKVIKDGYENEVVMKSVYGKSLFHPLYKNTFNVLIGLKPAGSSEDCNKGWQSVKLDVDDIGAVQALGKFKGEIFVGTTSNTSIKFVENNPNEWTTVDLPSSDAKINMFASSSDNIYAGGQDGVYIYKPEQNIWQKLGNLPFNDWKQVTAMALYKDILFLATQSGLYRWDSGDSTWKEVDDSKAFHALVAHDNFLYAGGDGGVLRLENTGLTPVGTWQGDFGDFPATLAVFKENLYAGSACCSPDNTGIYRYDQDPNKWINVFEGGVVSLAVSDDVIFAAVSDAGANPIYRSTSGESGSWEKIEPSPPSHKLSILVGKYLYVITTGNSISRIPLKCVQ